VSKPRIGRSSGEQAIYRSGATALDRAPERAGGAYVERAQRNDRRFQRPINGENDIDVSKRNNPRMVALPGAAFMASILFDVLALFADQPAQVRAYRRGAADLLRFGVSSSLASLTLEVSDYLHAPPGGEDASRSIFWT
jgi:hypothetical protein